MSRFDAVIFDMDGVIDGVDLSICLGDWDVGGP